MARTVTIRDIARHCGLSTATVSRVVNNKGAVRAETVERVEAAVSALGYRPSMAARTLKSSSSMTLGVIIPSLTNPVFAETAAGLQQRARTLGYTPLILSSDYDGALELSAVETLLAYQVDGVLLTVNDATNSAALQRLDEVGVSYCLMHNAPRQRVAAYVGVDNFCAAADVAGRILAAGHRCIGMISGEFVRTDRARERHAGFLSGLRQAGVALAQLVQVDPVNATGLQQALTAIYGQPGEQPTAWFCSNDLLALAAIAQLERLGLRVPEDISIVGFDGIQAGALRMPALTSVRTPNLEIGSAAVDALLAQPDHNTASGPSRQLGYQLVAGGTLASLTHSPVQHSPVQPFSERQRHA
ncbi:DNA-binding LacI/PurR family transcriptional regulator [Oceanisphaera litoralis]|uniref:LacI family DNA-binding transcriptional regulator n=1 Tax=Oceanisphaera litoralis TaxID=225144 RepID=UPI00195B67AC|nr:LacI family DNA-binding transcriptional regulator [Oceanisphaera litoralis]MBM7456111.1 DNA-binding LacI/PurR family transcriptional regulator [Oceanisphaera litoralis]